MTSSALPAPASGPTPPSGWYTTADGGHERYWDGHRWSAPRLRAQPVVVPLPESPDPSQRPERPAVDRPSYATVPPFALPQEVFVDPDPDRPLVVRRRSLGEGTGWAWLLASTPALSHLTASASGAPFVSAPWLALTGLLSVLLAVADVRRVRRAASLSWVWVLVPPLALVARTVVARSSWLIPWTGICASAAVLLVVLG